MKKYILLIAFLILIAPISFGQWVQQGGDIDGEAASDNFGWSVSLSADGSRVAAGALHNDGNGNNSGHARVYEYNGANWIQLGADIDGEALGDQSGSAVSLSADGNRLAVGAYSNDGNGNGSGHVRIFEFNGADWIQLGNDIDGEAASDRFGWSASLSADGNRVVIGGNHNDDNGNNAGHVRVFEFNGADWVQLGTDINGEAADDWFGYAVSINNSGNRIAVGGIFNDGNGIDSGHARIYEYNGIDWIQLGTDIDGEAANDGFGNTVSLNSDGSRIAVGGPGNDGNGVNSGHVRVYEYNGVDWIQLGTAIDGEAAGDGAGYVSLSDDGNRMAIGGIINNNGSGHVRIYEFNGIDWVQRGVDIDGEAANDLSGVALSLENGIVAIGAIENDGNNGMNSGHVRVYSEPYTLIPDPNFEQTLIDQGIDSEGLLDGQVLTFDISGIVNLDVSNENIADLSGIQDFTALSTLNCSMNQLTDLDFTDNNNLTTLLCNNNQLLSLNVTANSNLQSLSCQQNQLNSLNLRDLFMLTDFNGTANPLTCIAVNGRIRAVLNIGIYANWLVDDTTVYRLDCETPMLIAAKSPAITALPVKAVSVLPTVQLYPNPVEDRLQIVLPEGERLTRVVIYDLHGEQVLTTQSGVIDIEGLKKGLYIVAIQTANSQEFVYKKMVVSNR